jgi:hypothetical protein
MIILQTCKTHCCYITKDNLKDLNELIYEFSKNPLIDCDTSDLEKTSNAMQRNGQKFFLVQWISDYQDKVLKDYFHLIKSWDGRLMPNTALHTVAFRLEES